MADRRRAREEEVQARPVQEEPKSWHCDPRCNLYDVQAAGFSYLNALCELLDNSIRALQAKTSGQLLEVRVRIYKRDDDRWCLSVRDTGVGMWAAELPKWATLGSLHDPCGGFTRDVDPTCPDGNLHWWGVGGKSAAWRLCQSDGRTEVTSRKPVADGGPDVNVLILDKRVMQQRELMQRQAAEGGAPAGESPYHLAGFVRPPSAVECGEVLADDGGRWDGGAGTEIVMVGVEEDFARCLWEPEQRKVLMAKLQDIYSPYISGPGPELPRCPGFNARFGEPSCARAGASKARRLNEPTAARKVDLFVQGELVGQAEGGLMRQLLVGAKHEEGQLLEVGLALSFDGAPETVHQARLVLGYGPFEGGRSSRPTDALQEQWGMRPRDAALIRCGRLLQSNGRAALLDLRDLFVAPGAPARVLNRIVALCFLGFTWRPKSDKAMLTPDSPEALAMASFFTANSSLPQGANLLMCLRYTNDKKEPRAIGWRPANLATLRQEMLLWAEACHRLHDKEAILSVPANDVVHILYTILGEHRETLKLPDSLEPASVWTQLDLPWGTTAKAFSVKVTQPARPQRIVLHYRPDQKHQPSNNPSEHGRMRDVPMRLHFFVTRGLPDNSDLGYTTAVAVLTPWHIPETEWPRIVAESSTSDLIISGNYRTASARLELGAAAVAVPFNLLTEATSVSTESAWNAAVATERALMPSALTLSPRHVASASNPSTGAAVAAQLTDGATLAHDAVLPNELAVVLLRDGKKDVWTEITHKKPSRVTLTVTPFDATDRPPVEMQLVPADKAGVFRFDTRFAWEMLREAGKYSLTFSASGLPDARSAGLQPVAPLVITVTRAAVPKVRGLDKNAQWGGCTHRGQCEGTGTKCMFLAGALKEGKNTGVLDGAPMDSNLYLVQNNENMGWPADKAVLVAKLKLEVWDRSGSGQRLLPGVTVAPLTEDDLTVAADGTDLILRNVRLLGNASLLPFNPDESTRQGEIEALLRVSMPNSKVVGGSTLKGGCEIEILVSAGAAASLVVMPAELGALEPGKTIDIQAQLLDARGNPTARGADGKLAVELAPKLVGLELDRERCIVDARARTATVRATVTAPFGKPLSAEFSVPGMLQGPSSRLPPAVTAKSSGHTVARTLRLVDPPAQLSAQVGAPFSVTEGLVVQVVDGDATVVTSFEGHLEISTSSAHQGDKHAAWFTALANLAVPIQQGCARLPALPPIGHIGNYTIFLSIKGHKDNKKLPLPVTVTAAMATRLEAVPPEDAAQLGVPFRLRFRAFSAANNEVPVTHELASALVVQSDSGFVLDGVQLDAAGSAALQLTFDCAPCSASLTASYGAHRLTWAVDVQPGPPVRARCVVEGAESAGGAFVVRSGEAMRCTFTLLDAFDNECTPSAADVYRLQRQGVTWVTWSQRTTERAELSAPEAAGDSTLTFELERRVGAGRARTKWEALEGDGATVECALRVLPSPAAKNITLGGGEAPLNVVAGKTLRFARVVVRSAEGLTPRPLISVMSLTWKCDPPRDGPSDPRLRQGVTGKLYAETPLPTDGAVFSGELQAPTQAGPYSLELTNDRATLCVAVQVVADASGALKVDFINRARLPRHVSYPACVFAPQLDFQVSDAYGNPVDLSQLWKHCAAEVVFVRVLDERTERSELLSNVKNEVDPELLAQGIIRFKNVALGTTTWPSGNFKMRLRTSGQLSVAEADNATSKKPHTFSWTGQDGVQEDAGKKQLRLAYENLRDVHSDSVAALSINHMALKRSEAEHQRAVKHAKECDAEAKSRAGAVAGQLRGEVRDASAFVEAAKAQAQPAQCTVSQKGCPSAVHKYHRGGKASLHARLHADSDVLCQVWELLRAETPQLRTVLLQRCGHRDLGLLAVLSEGAGVQARKELGEGASCLRLDLPQFRAFDRGVDDSRPQRPLKLPPLPAPGFVGYLVNLVHLAPEHLAWRFPSSCRAGLRGLGLRETVLWNVLGNLKVFDTHAALQAFCRAPGNSDLGRGCCTLDGVMMQANAREHGSDVYPAPAWLQLPGVPWAERERSTLDPALRNALRACEALAPLRAEAEQAESARASAAQSLQDAAQALGQCRESHAARDAEVRAAAASLASAKTQAEQAGVDCSEGST